MIIGICGKSGSGKSTLAREIVNTHNRAINLDIDKIGHRVLTVEEVKEELVRCFGDVILSEQTIDRKKLGALVFSSQTKMGKLSDITWKYMRIEIDKFISEHQENIIILDWLLLPSTKYFSMCQVKILMDISYEIRKRRAMVRDCITESEFDLRDQASIDFNRNDFDIVIKDNNQAKIRKLVKNI